MTAPTDGKSRFRKMENAALFFSSIKGTKGKIAAEKAADAWLESGLASESTKCGELLDAYFGHISKSTSKSNANQQENFVKTT